MRMRLRKKVKKVKLINKITILLIFIIIFVFYFLNKINKYVVTEFIGYSEIETKKIVSNIISSTLIDDIANSTDIDKLFSTITDSSGNIKSIDLMSPAINKILVSASDRVLANLNYLKHGEVEKLKLSNETLSIYDNDKLKNGIIYEIPTGMIFNNIFLNNLLPKIPVKIDLIGNMFCRLSTDIESYGINNALIKVNIVIEVEVKILLPLMSSSEKIEASIPIVMKIIEGDVPNYYYDGFLNEPVITNPVN